MNNYTQLADEALERAHLIEANLPAGFDIAMLTLKSKLPFKALSIREVLIHRIADLALSAAESLKARRVISAATLTRATMETLARIMELHQRLESFERDPNVAEMGKYLDSTLLGSRSNADMPTATNVMGAIQKADKIVPHFLENYERMCEYAHPNWSGALGTFGNIDKDNFRLNLGNPRRVGMALRTIGFMLNGTLEGFPVFYNALADAIGRFNDYFENEGCSKPT